jgi:hypothetical protein
MLYKEYYLLWCKENAKLSVSADKHHRIFRFQCNIGFQMPKSGRCRIYDKLIIKINEPDIEGKENERTAYSSFR